MTASRETLVVAELLISIGWKDSCDAQWEHLEQAIPQLQEILRASPKPEPAAGGDVAEAVRLLYHWAGDPKLFEDYNQAKVQDGLSKSAALIEALAHGREVEK